MKSGMDLARRTRRLGVTVAVVGALVAAAPAAGAHEGAGCVALVNDMDVIADVKICPGIYDFDDPEEDGVLRVRASGVMVDMEGVTLRSAIMRGWGVWADGVDAVTVLGGTIRGFRSAVLLMNGMGHRVQGCDLSFNRKRPVTHSPADFLQVWPDFPGQLAADQIGNGVVLVNVGYAAVRRNVMREQQNGVGLFGCHHVEVVGNDCSDNEGWGIHMLRSSDNWIVGNRADNCFNKVSTYCHQVQQDGCDTAALLLMKESNDNRVIGNSLRNSGDGVFSAAQEGPIHWGADRNEYVGNDCRFAKHIGLEATFTEGNVFRRNLASNAGRYGFWLGYSRNALVKGNRIEDNATAGISNESAQHITVVDNVIRGNRVGVELRRGSFSALAQDSRDHRFERNLVSGNTAEGFSITDTHEVVITRCNIIGNLGGNVRFRAAKEVSIDGPLNVRENNVLLGGAPWNVSNEQATEVSLTHNWWGTTDPDAIQATIRGLDQLAVIPPHRLARLEITFMLGAEGPYTLRRVVNERAGDASEALAGFVPADGNALPEVGFGAEHGGEYTSGFRFRDVYVPSSATVLAAHLVLPTDASPAGGGPLSVFVFGDASDDALPFEAGSMPRGRARTGAFVHWTDPAAWSDMGWAQSADLTPIVDEILARPGWESGNAMAFVLDDAGSTAPRRVWAFDREGYAQLPGTPYEFRRYRKHRFAKLELGYALGLQSMVLERELSGGTDDADGCVGCNEVHFGLLGGPQFAGFRFPRVDLPPAAAVGGARLWMPTDGTYTNPLSLEIRGEALAAAPPYGPGSLPAGRPRTAASVPWAVANTWIFTEWHPTPDVDPLVEAVRAVPGWVSGAPMAFDVLDAGSSGHRRVWAFDRDPRIIDHDFPEIGATPFRPFLERPLR